MAYTDIRDYAVIGNLRSAALVSKQGSIDWACAPFLDSPSIFAKLLDEARGGFWSIAPTQEYTVVQQYYQKSNVLRTTFTTKDGECELVDFAPIEETKDIMPLEQDVTFKLKRKVTCVKGESVVRVIFCPRFHYGLADTMITETESGIIAQHGTSRGVLVSTCALTVQDNCAQAEVRLREGESRYFIFRYNLVQGFERDMRETGYQYHDKEIEKTNQVWRDWLASSENTLQATIMERWRPMVERSLLMLKILFFDPIGTVAAAVTTSLPEGIGGERNWDYRYTWIRDSAFLFKAFSKLGFLEERREYVRWILTTCRGLRHPSELQVLYPLHHFNTTVQELVLGHLSGYRDSKPVRIGNAAHTQRQWDVYGVLFDMVYDLCAVDGKGAVNKEEWQVLRSTADFIAERWREPDAGIWEVRGEERQFTFSKVMCWVALDRAVALNALLSPRKSCARWEKERDAIRKLVEDRGWNKTLRSFTATLDTDGFDTSSLLFSSVGFLDGKDPRMLATIHAVRNALSCGSVLLRRYVYPDGVSGSEGAFLLSSFWLVDALTLAGEVEEAERVFEELLTLANHVGLFSEEIEPNTKEFLGNFPQAYTHVGLVHSAILLSKARMAG